MDKEIIQAYLWDKIIRLTFKPSGDKEQKSWLHQYGKSLKDFWEVEEYPISGTSQNFLSVTVDSGGDLSFQYKLNSHSRSSHSTFSVRFIFPPRNLMWEHHVDPDPKYFKFPESFILSQLHHERTALHDFKNSRTPEEYIAQVIDGLLCHPRAHQHIKSPINKHNIRIGGGIDNAYVFLFHLRYQLCPIPEKRVAERERLITLFHKAIRNNASSIPPRDLMEQP